MHTQTDAVQTTANTQPYGKLVLPFGFTKRTILAGPWRNRPPGVIGVKLAREQKGHARYFLPIEDYCVPMSDVETDKIVREVLTLLATEPEQDVYAGCGYGQGRTGLFLSLLAKTMGIVDPVAHVRKHYNPKAVENRVQEAYVRDYRVPFSGLELWWLKARAFLANFSFS